MTAPPTWAADAHLGAALVPARAAALLQPDAAAARAAALDVNADEYLAATRPTNTRDAYAQDWATWEDYTRWAGVAVLSGGRGVLVGFVVWLEHSQPGPGRERSWPGAAPATIERRIWGVQHELRRLHVPLDPLAGRAAAEALKVYRRGLAAANERPGRGQAHPVDVADVLAMSRACPDTLAGLRDRAVITVGFYAAARASDLSNLMTGDLTIERTGLVVNIRVGKTTGITGLPARKNPLLCPRLAYLNWQRAADLADGPALRSVRGNVTGQKKLSPDAVTSIVTRCGRRAGLPYLATCHGFRSGFATASYRAGTDLLTIARHGRWADNSAELLGYIRALTRWQNNAADGLDIDPEGVASP